MKKIKAASIVSMDRGLFGEPAADILRILRRDMVFIEDRAVDSCDTQRFHEDRGIVLSRNADVRSAGVVQMK